MAKQGDKVSTNLVVNLEILLRPGRLSQTEERRRLAPAIHGRAVELKCRSE